MSSSPVFDHIRMLVRQIPKGYVSTYGAVARAAGVDPRVVGWALRGNQDKTIPCHRVVQKSGTLSPNFSLGGWQEQRRRLLKDRTRFIRPNQVDLTCVFTDFTL
ncbi:MAG: MGMT family protein [Candidatus Shapirobacteria bacterium]|jgi:methylated-DNA-protein-cysteine methyltransferase-like protein